MRLRALATLSSGVAVVALVAACHDWDRYDPRLHGGTGGESGHASSSTGEGGKGGSTNGTVGGGGSSGCTGDDFQCRADGSARQCTNSDWVDLGACPLGCDEASRACRVPSNAPVAKIEPASGALVTDADAETVIDTDTGEIRRGGALLRPAGPGLDTVSHIAFFTAGQGTGNPRLGVFSLRSLDVPKGTILRGSGGGALVLIVDGAVVIDGLVTVAATQAAAGPGGSKGGDPGQDGAGRCGGQAGIGTAGGHGCAAGGGGAGFFAKGGQGGASKCASPDDHPGGVAGSTCGTPTLVPLLGGSGGAGGTVIPNISDFESMPGPGGGGGGALQISSSKAITVSASGRIDAAGGGGGQTITGGGAGGGAGGAILLEAPNVTVATGAILAANGGGGGGGDCT